jgi:hypothetical protein
MHLTRGFRLKSSGKAALGEPHQGLFTLGDAEKAEQVLSNAIVQACLVRAAVFRGGMRDRG